MRTRKRSLSLLLCGALLFSLCPQTASAVSIPKTGAESSGLCEHHTEHNADCGYTEGIEGTPCNHEHTEDCYTLVTECVTSIQRTATRRKACRTIRHPVRCGKSGAGKLHPRVQRGKRLYQKGAGLPA